MVGSSTTQDKGTRDCGRMIRFYPESRVAMAEPTFSSLVRISSSRESPGRDPTTNTFRSEQMQRLREGVVQAYDLAKQLRIQSSP